MKFEKTKIKQEENNKNNYEIVQKPHKTQKHIKIERKDKKKMLFFVDFIYDS